MAAKALVSVALVLLVGGCSSGPQGTGPDGECEDGDVFGCPSVCGDGVLELGEECDPPMPGVCNPNCTLPNVAVTVHWSFQTLSGDAKAPCLPGDPDVTLVATVQGYGGIEMPGQPMSLPCAVGEATLQLPKSLGVGVSVSSIADHEYDGGVGFVVPPVDPPTAIVYTDAGSLDLDWNVTDAYGTPSTCEEAGIKTVHVLLDGAKTRIADCDALGNMGTFVAGPILQGPHSLRVYGLDPTGRIIATGSSDATVVADTTVDARVTLRE